MNFLEIRLVGYGKSYQLPKEFIRTQLAKSLLDEALVEEPDLKLLELTNLDASPHVLESLVKLANGIEPRVHPAEMRLGHRYLNIPIVLPFCQPAYHRIPDRDDPNADINKHFIRYVIRSDNIILFRYLHARGLKITENHYKQAIGRSSKKILRWLLNRDIDGLPSLSLENAVWSQQEASVAVLLEYAWSFKSEEREDAYRLAHQLACGLPYREELFSIVKLLAKHVNLDTCWERHEDMYEENMDIPCPCY